MFLDKNENAVFLDFYSKFRKSITENQFNEFSNLTDNKERIKLVTKWLNSGKVSLPNQNSKAASKDIQISAKFKEDGNKAFQKADYQQALFFYSQSIKYATWSEQDSENICVLLANRSAALYHLENYEAALSDIGQCMKLGGYPKHLHFKVLDRKARCLLAGNQHLSARDTFRLTLSALDHATGLDNPRRAKWQRDVQIMISMLEHGNKQLRNAPKPKKEELPAVNGGTNETFPTASANLKPEYGGESEGRLVRATTDISPGDLLVVEKPYVIALLPEHLSTHCWHCLEVLKASLPCPRCPDVSFCSTQCQKAALSGHHGFECSFLPALREIGAAITCLLALRAISQTPLANFKALSGKLQRVEGDDLKDLKVYKSNDYATFYRLVSHESRRPSHDLLHRTLMAIFLLRGLTKGGYFGTDLPQDLAENLSEDQVLIGSLLLHNLQVCQFNAHEVSELLCSEQSFLDTGYVPDEEVKYNSVFLGGAVYPTLALFNHSCNPGVVRYFLKGGAVVARAIRSFSEGEEICENYGPMYTRETREVRQATLKDQYWFQCTCEACDQNWPIFYQINEQSTLALRCGTCGASIRVSENSEEIVVSCRICGNKTSVLASLAAVANTDRQLQSARSKETSGELSAALHEYLQVIKVLHKFLPPPPTKDYVLCQQATRRCMLQLGKSRTAPKKIQIKLQ